MGNYKAFNIIAVIDIGSNYIKMIIAEVDGKSEIKVLDQVVKYTNIGKDTFNTGRISVKTIREICSILKSFKQLMKEYGVKKHRVVATTGIREAENRGYVLEQIKVSTRLKVEIIKNAQERFFIYKALKSDANVLKLIKSESTLIVNASSGGMEISVFQNGSLKISEFIKIGTLRIKEMLSNLEERVSDFPLLMEEYIESKLSFYRKDIEKANVKNFIVLGGELDTIYRIIENKEDKILARYVFHKDKIQLLYKELLKMSNEQIVEKYNISYNVAELLVPSLIIYNNFLKSTDINTIHAPRISLRHGILMDIEDEIFNLPRKEDLVQDIINSVWHIANKYNIDENHCKLVQDIALSIFDQSKNLHKLGNRERLYLKVASILHDVGKYIGINDHSRNSYDIVRKQNIVGFSDEDMDIIANIIKYHEKEIPEYSHKSYIKLAKEERITVSKLVAILKIAEALDISHNQKVKEVSIVKEKEELIFKIKHKDEILLETWDFNRKASFFGELMGVEPKIRE